MAKKFGKKRIIISVLVLLVVLGCVVGLGPLLRHMDASKTNSDSPETPVVSAEPMMEEDYTKALALFESGDYEGAKAVFEALGDYKDSKEYLDECDNIAAAVGMLEAGDFFAAWDAFEALDRYADSQVKIEECREGIYNSALQDMILSEFETAKEKFEKLGEYKLSQIQLANCTERLAAEAEFKGNSAIVYHAWADDFDEGNIYIHTRGYFYVPKEVTEETAWIIYFPGGVGIGQNLSVESVWLEHTLFNPNAIVIWLWDNGFCDMPRFVLEDVWELMKQLALECDIWFHDVATVGSSNGCYCAIMAAEELYSNFGVKVDNVIAFDPGLEWDEPEVLERVLLDDEQSDMLAEAGTMLYLMEQHDFTDYFTEKAPIMDMLEHGINIVIVECVNDGHNHIGPDGIRAGAYQFAINEQDHLDSDQYTFWTVYADGSKEPYSRNNTDK